MDSPRGTLDLSKLADLKKLLPFIAAYLVCQAFGAGDGQPITKSFPLERAPLQSDGQPTIAGWLSLLRMCTFWVWGTQKVCSDRLIARQA